MKGSIRAFVGLFIVFGAVGGMDTVGDGDLLLATLIAVLGLLLMYSGVRAMNGGKFNG
jgi:hypothetical protein